MRSRKLIATLLLICTVCAALLTSCAPSYKEFHTDENAVASCAVGGQKATAYIFKNNEDMAVLDVCRIDGENILRAELPETGEFYTSLDYDYALYNTVFQDMNFDGELDLYVPCSVTTANLEGMAWLWDEKEGAFVLSEELSMLYEITVISDEKIIKSTDYMNEDGPLCTEYKWEDGKLTKVDSYTAGSEA